MLQGVVQKKKVSGSSAPSEASSMQEVAQSEERLRSTEKEVVVMVDHDDTPPGVHNLEAMHTIALLFPLIGMILPVCYSCSVYLDDNTT